MSSAAIPPFMQGKGTLSSTFLSQEQTMTLRLGRSTKPESAALLLLLFFFLFSSPYAAVARLGEVHMNTSPGMPEFLMARDVQTPFDTTLTNFDVTVHHREFSKTTCPLWTVAIVACDFAIFETPLIFSLWCQLAKLVCREESLKVITPGLNATLRFACYLVIVNLSILY